MDKAHLKQIALQIIGAVAILAPIPSYYYYKYRKHQERILKALHKLNLTIEDDQKKPKIKYKNTKKKIVFKEFNYSKSTIDLKKIKTNLEEIFSIEILDIIRRGINQIEIKKAIYPEQLENKNSHKILIGHNGAEYLHKEDDETSLFIFGLSGTGKTYFSLSIIKQYIKKGYRVIVYTEKESDFKEIANTIQLENYDDEGNVLQELHTINDNRRENEKNDIKGQKTLIVMDEIQTINKNKEICENINTLIRMGRSQSIEFLAITQSGQSSLLSNINISLMKIQIAIRHTESQAFAETIFPPEIAQESYFKPLNFGNGYIKKTTYSGRVKLFYEK